MVSFETIVRYLEELGVKHKEIQNSFRWNSAEINGAVRSGFAQPFMLIDAPTVEELYVSNKLFHVHNCAVTILGEEGVDTTQLDSYDAQNRVLDYTQRICFDIAARIRHDSKLTEINGEKNTLYNLLDQGSFTFFKAGPVFSNHFYGYRAEFRLKTKAPCSVVTDNWNDLD